MQLSHLRKLIDDTLRQSGREHLWIEAEWNNVIGLDFPHVALFLFGQPVGLFLTGWNFDECRWTITEWPSDLPPRPCERPTPEQQRELSEGWARDVEQIAEVLR